MHLLDKVKKAIIKIEYNLRQRYWGDDGPGHEWIAFYNVPNKYPISKYWQPGILNINDIGHGEIMPTNATLKWYGMDSEEEFDKTDHSQSTYTWTKDNVNYTFNSYGYRGDEPVCDGDINILVCGDSHTFGVGLDDLQVWTAQLKKMCEKKFKKVKIINLSCPGASNDYIARVLYCALQKLNPDFVIAQYTYPNRREAIWQSGLLWELNTTIPDNHNQDEYEEEQAWFMTINDHTDAYNIQRNHNLVQAICNSKKIDYFVWHAYHMSEWHKAYYGLTKKLDHARDNKHFGARIHKMMAQKIYSTLKKWSKFSNKSHAL